MSPAIGAADPAAELTGIAARDLDGDARTRPADIGADVYRAPGAREAREARDAHDVAVTTRYYWRARSRPSVPILAVVPTGSGVMVGADLRF